MQAENGMSEKDALSVLKAKMGRICTVWYIYREGRTPGV
jgi:hypothetical protein